MIIHTVTALQFSMPLRYRLLITFTFQFQEVISCDNFCIGLCCKLGSDCFTIFFFSFCSGVEHVEEAKRIPQSA